ncbi:MAG: PTS sugar transporter subunit IIA [bacterium]
MANTNLSQWLSATDINLKLSADSELETISAMLDLASNSGVVADVKQLASELLAHEIYTPSPTGCCAVVFRVLSPVVAEPRMFFGRFDGGIGYYSKKGQPIDLIVLIIAPPEKQDDFVQLTQKMERVLCESSVSEPLRAAEDAREILRVFSDSVFNSFVCEQCGQLMPEEHACVKGNKKLCLRCALKYD